MDLLSRGDRPAAQMNFTSSVPWRVGNELYASDIADTDADDPLPEFFVEKDALRIDYPAHLRVLLTIPPRIDGQPPDPDGHSECMLYGPAKAKIVNDPDYPAAVPKPLGTELPYIVKPTPNMGLGLFAARDIEAGELIVAERPLLIAPRDIANMIFPLSLEESDIIPLRVRLVFAKITMYEFNRRIETTLTRMTPKSQKDYKSLSKSRDSSIPHLTGIFVNNSLAASFLPNPPVDENNIPPEEDEDQEIFDDYLGVTKIGSRVNHSCIPNAHFTFSVPSFSFNFTALTNIKAGDQIFRAYCDYSQPEAGRQADLSRRGIDKCTCPACANATPESDKLRSEYQQRTMDWFERIIEPDPATRAPRSMTHEETRAEVGRLLAFRRELADEGLMFTGEYGMTAVLIFELYSRLGMDEEAKEFGDEFLTLRKAVLGQ